MVVGVSYALRLPMLPMALPLRAASVAFFVGTLILLRSSARLTRRFGRTLLVGALALSVFWITTQYAESEGRQFAKQVDDSPAHLPLATIYSAKYLDLPGSAVILTVEESSSGPPLYRYSGLRVLAFSADRWFLITGRYDGYRSTVAIIKDDGGVRVDVARQNQE